MASLFPVSSGTAANTLDVLVSQIAGINLTDIAAETLVAIDQSLIGARSFVRSASNITGFRTSLNLPGLVNDVRVEQEPSGIVHIQAQNDDDLFFALGAVHASDRLWQMDFQRRVAAGRLSEVLGATTVQQDVLNRTLGLYSAAQSAYDSLSPDIQRVVDRYATGVNAYLGLGSPLPLEFQLLGYQPEPWRPVDVLATSKLQSLGLSTNFQAELYRSQLIERGISFERIQELFPIYQGDITILQPDDVAKIPGLSPAVSSVPQNLDLSGLAAADNLDLAAVDDLLAVSRSLAPTSFASNNWVVSGALTTTGKPFLANDPHIGLQIPSVWYPAELESPTYHAIGATFPGLPGIVIGHNDQIAWGVTNSQADVQDLYALAETPDRQGYVYNGEVRSYEVRLETIQVKGQPDRVIPVRESVYGPVISDVIGAVQPLSLRWVSLDEADGTLEAFIQVNRAQNWSEFTNAFQSFVAPGQNFVYADRDGNIGYFLPGKFPIRNLAAGHTGLLPVPGTGEFDWQGFIPFEQLPQVLNPESGFIVTANNRVAPSNYPYPISFEWAEPYRAERISNLIQTLSADKLSLQEMQTIQLDQTTLLYRDFRPVLQQLKPILTNLSAPAATLQWLDRLLNWDGNLQPDSQEATVFEAWYNELTKFIAATIGQPVLVGNQQEPAPRFLLKALTQGDPALGGSVEQALGNAATALQQAVTNLGSSVPRWGDLHQTVFKHPVLPLTRQVAYGGDRYTVNVGTYNSTNFRMDSNGPTYRQIIDLEDPDNSRYIQAIGQSGRFFSPYFDNLLLLWQQGRYVPMETVGYPVTSRLLLKA
jgi:penicillin amidase